MIESFSLICLTASAAALSRSSGLRAVKKLGNFEFSRKPAVCLVQPGSFQKFWELQRLIWVPLITDFTVLY